MLGASGVQMGTAYLFCPEANVSPLHRQALKTAQDDQTVLTNVLSGRAARAIVNRIVRELGPMTEHLTRPAPIPCRVARRKELLKVA
jgi:nitronate monooxygenase